MAMNKIEKLSKIRKICVYCGSSPGTSPAFVQAARDFGKILAQNGVGLVYGGGHVGIMGEISLAVLKHGGDVNGIIPEFLVAREDRTSAAQRWSCPSTHRSRFAQMVIHWAGC